MRWLANSSPRRRMASRSTLHGSWTSYTRLTPEPRTNPNRFASPAINDILASAEMVATEVATAIMAARLTKMEITDEAEEEVEEEDEDEAEGEGANQLKRNNVRQHTEFFITRSLFQS